MLFWTALLQDEAVIGVVIQDETESDKARKILERRGARFLVYLGGS